MSIVRIGRSLKIIPGDLDKGAFASCSSLTTIYIPNNIVLIYSEAFKNSGLTEVTFEKDSRLTQIGSSAFQDTNLKSIIIPKSVIAISNCAFSNISISLKKVDFEEESQLKTIGKYCFSNDYSIENINLPKQLEEIGAKAFESTLSLKTIIFPSNLQTLGDYAFINSGLKDNINIPTSLTKMGANPFASCHSLTSITVDKDNPIYQSVNGVVYSKENVSYTLSGTIISPKRYALIIYPAGNINNEYTILNDTNIIEDSAFYGSYNLNYIYLNIGLQEIHRYAFYDCENLYNMNIPDNVIQISNYAFAYTKNLYTVNFNETSKLPRISIYSFAFSGIYTFRVPHNVSSLAQYAFLGCDNLTQIVFSADSKLGYISAYQFKGCDNLQSITFENGSSLTNIEAHAFEDCGIYTINFGDAKITNIDNYAFRYCFNLQSITIPDTVTYIGRYAFYGDTSLSQIIIPESVEYIGRYAFYTKDDRMNIYFQSDTLPEYAQETWDEGIKGYYMGVASIETSGDWEYSKMTNGNISLIKYNGTDINIDLTSLNLGGNITSIGGYCFYRSTVEEIKLPSTLKIISQYAFAYSNIKDIRIPNSVTSIGKYAFYHTTQLLNVTFENNSIISRIDKYAFAWTESLEKISLPQSIEFLGTYIFYKSNLKEINFAEDILLTEIPKNAFEGAQLESIIIPKNITLINHNAFRDIASLKQVKFNCINDFYLYSNVFYNTGLEELYIPSNCAYIGEYAFVGLSNLNSYEVDANNEHYESIDGVLYSKLDHKLMCFPANRRGSFTIPSYVQSIGFGAFENTKLSEVNFEEGINLLTIGWRAFFNADNLEVINIPASVISIDYYAFAYCDKLTTINFAEDNKLTGIYEGAFYLDKSLQNIIIPDTIIEISDYAFYGCESLTQLPISPTNELKSIGEYAFAYTGLTELTVPDSVIDLGAYSFMGCKLKSVYISNVNEKDLVIGIGVLQDCEDLEALSLPFAGESISCNNNWFGYIFGAGSFDANSSYIPSSLHDIIIDYGPKNIIFDGDDTSGEILTYNGTFGDHRNIRNLTINKNTVTISSKAFYLCSN